ncbi:MAG: hypothetical protein IT553_02100 [Sphingomonadaceae bacterium]|nr:hypothetical protein [Sphingomonadaceae bacterium]
MSRSNRNPAYRRYMWRSLLISTAYIATILLAVWAIPDNAPTAPAYLPFALLPGIIIGGWVWAMARLLVELQDEYLRFLEVQKILVATGVTLAWTGAWGVAELFLPHLPKVPVFFVFPAWCLGLVVGQLVVRIRFGADGGCP